MAYQVLKTYGDNEPWWFFDEWEKDITEVVEFPTFEEAKEYFENSFQSWRLAFPQIIAKKNYLSAFWKEEDARWCKECNDYLQQIHGLLLLEDGKVIDKHLADFKGIISTQIIKKRSCKLRFRRD